MPARQRHRFDPRPVAALLVVISFGLLFLLAFAAQVLAWDMKYIIDAVQAESPLVTSQYMKMFGLRPHGYLMPVLMWFWWPMVASLVHCLFRYRHPREFAIAFAYWFAFCWLAAAFVLMLTVFPLVIARVMLLQELEQPPDYMRWVDRISYALPVLVIAFSIACWWRNRK